VRCKKLFGLILFGADAEQRVDGAKVDDSGDKRNQPDQTDPANGAIQKNEQAQDCYAEYNTDPAIHVSNILFHNKNPSFI
jgi:hypothetical protein